MADDEVQTGRDAWSGWRGRMTASRTKRDDRLPVWQENVEKRKGENAATTSSRHIYVNQDWPITKAKIAQLYSQTPKIILTPRDEMFRQMVTPFGEELNDTIDDVDVGSTIGECLADVVNAAGNAAVLVSCDKRTEPREVPAIDPATLPPDIQQAVMTGAFEMPMETVEHTVDLQYLAERISPADLLIPSDFTGSNYDKARWLGHDGRMTWTQGTRALGLTEEQKEDVLGRDKRASGVTNSLNTETRTFRDTEVVNYTELFYWRHFYHHDETSFKALQRLVFVDGLEEPVINEPYRGQQRQQDRIVGVTKNPIRVLTLTYISDDSLPPSDSTIIREQVNELEDSRDDMSQQRKQSIPIRWYDTNRVSGGTKSLLEKGTYQGFIPTNGPGDRAVGEVSRASFPPEKYEFDKIIKNDITEMAQVGTNQAGAFASGERSAKEAGIIQQNFQRRVGQEQDKVTKFLLGIAEVLAGHLALYGTFDLPDELGEQRAAMANAFTYSVRVDSTVRLDAEQRIEQLMRFLNMTAQSGFINPQPVIAEIAELSGLDPAKVVITPQPKAPEPVKVSVNNALDIRDPLFLATLMRTKQAPGPEDLSAALKLLASVTLPVPPPVEPGSPDGRPPSEVQSPEISNPDWESAPRVERRAADGGA